jgi:hypothetical protein
MPQGLVTLVFSFIKLIYIILGVILKSEIVKLKEYNDFEPLLLISNTPNSPIIVLYYINNIFSGL